MNFPHSALFHNNTKVCLICFGQDCSEKGRIWNQQNHHLIYLTISKKIIYNNHKLKMKSYNMAVCSKLVQSHFPPLFLIPLSLFPLFPLQYQSILNVTIFQVRLVLFGSCLSVKLLNNPFQGYQMLPRLSKILLPDLVNKASTEFDHHLICRFAFSFKTTAVNVSFVSISACQHVTVVKSKTHIQQCKRKDLSKQF